MPLTNTALPIAANRLLMRLPESDRQHLIDRCDEVDLIQSEVLCERGDHISQVYFPIDCSILMTTPAGPHDGFELSMVGAGRHARDYLGTGHRRGTSAGTRPEFWVGTTTDDRCVSERASEQLYIDSAARSVSRCADVANGSGGHLRAIPPCGSAPGALPADQLLVKKPT